MYLSTELPQGIKPVLHNQQLFAGLQTGILSHVLWHEFTTTVDICGAANPSYCPSNIR